MTGLRHRCGRTSNYDKTPTIHAGSAAECVVGWPAIAATLAATGARVFVAETYPGVRADDLAALAQALDARLIDAGRALWGARRIDRVIAAELTDDPVFGRLSRRELHEFFDPARIAELRGEASTGGGRVLVAGPGASLITRGDVLTYADMPRWELQQRQRAGVIGNLGADNAGAAPSQLYKRGYFVDWRVADRHKRGLWDEVDFFIETVSAERPRLLARSVVDRALAAAVRQPLRVVPFFDPAPWGGQWMKEVCDLPRSVANYGWCFDCVPEENSLLLGFGAERFEIPAIDLVFRHPRELLGESVEQRFGAEFPIRFDFLDTIDGGNLSLQVHPLTDYIRAHFGLGYTQDESYYLLDAAPEAHVHLGVRSGVDRAEMLAALRRAERGEAAFAVDRFVNSFPARRHDHFLIPAGTVHGSGAGSMVLEISATPYIFTFKLYDWGRPGLDGKPRPLHIEHGARNIRFDRDTAYARAQLINRVTPLEAGAGWRSERTGLHANEFIETHRHWFTAPARHAAMGTVQVLNLVEGEAASVESPDGVFAPFTVHYAETFIVPAAAGAYAIRPLAAGEHATIKAFVRPLAAEVRPLAYSAP